MLSHRSAAALWGLGFGAGSRVDVTTAGRKGHSRGGLRVHRVRRFDRRDATVRDAIPLTSVPRTLLDLAEVVCREAGLPPPAVNVIVASGQRAAF